MTNNQHDIHYLWGLVEELNREFFANRVVINEIEISSLERDINGIYYAKEKKIVLDEKCFRTASHDELEYIVYHEMCHQFINKHNTEFNLFIKNYFRKRKMDKLGERAWKIRRNIETIFDILCMFLIVSGFSVLVYESSRENLTLLCITISVSLILSGFILSIWLTARSGDVLDLPFSYDLDNFRSK
jgi:hypothetical protein